MKALLASASDQSDDCIDLAIAVMPGSSFYYKWLSEQR